MGIQLLDCTLRDGGYVNDWKFGHRTAYCIAERLIEAGVDIIEVGFLDERRPFDSERTIQPDTKAYNRVFAGLRKKDSMLVAMIDYGTCGIERISPCQDSILDGIRVIFKQPKMREAVLFGRQLGQLGYKVFLQMVSITAYSDLDLLELIDLVNKQPPYAVSMVDTYGLMHKEEMLHYFYLLDHNLEDTIHIGYHSHNNFQLAYANTTSMISRRCKHDLLVDGTLYGMGKSAGNAPLELLAMYLNENNEGAYQIDQILEVIDTNILPIYYRKYWGYSLLYYLAALNDCHPDYVRYLLDKKTLSVRSINDIVGCIPKKQRLNYTESLIEHEYIRYQKSIAQEQANALELRQKLRDLNLLLLGPGKSILSHQSQIIDYVKKTHPIVIALNFIPKEPYAPNMVFFSNTKRYSMFISELQALQGKTDIIATSNLIAAGRSFDYVLDYAALLSKEALIEDNTLIMLLRFLTTCSPGAVVLAGFDGFGANAGESYYDDSLEFSTNYQRLAKVNRTISDCLSEFRDTLKLTFLTPSVYDGNE